jgi:seryl-tRNA synthetase
MNPLDRMSDADTFISKVNSLTEHIKELINDKNELKNTNENAKEQMEYLSEQLKMINEQYEPILTEWEETAKDTIGAKETAEPNQPANLNKEKAELAITALQEAKKELDGLMSGGKRRNNGSKLRHGSRRGHRRSYRRSYSHRRSHKALKRTRKHRR